jgi:hypothetical protein
MKQVSRKRCKPLPFEQVSLALSYNDRLDHVWDTAVVARKVMRHPDSWNALYYSVRAVLG